MNGKKPYEGIVTEAEMMTLIENISNTAHVEWDEYDMGDNEKASYPMWKAVVASEGDTYEDFLNYFKAAKAKMSGKDVVVTDDEKVGIVEPEDDFEEQTEVSLTESATPVFGGEDLAAKVRRLMNRPLVASDNSGVVKPKSEGMPTKTTKQVTEVDSTKESKPEIDVAKKAPKAGVGVVKPSDAFNTQTKVDVTAGKGLTKGPNQLSDNSGIVKPKAEGFKSSAKPEIKIDASKPIAAEIDKAAKSVKPTVGMIKPKGDLNPNPKPITFKDFLK